MRLSTYRIVIIILTILIVTTGLKAQLNLDSGLVAFYPFYGNAHDYSVNANHGIVNGATLVDDRFGNVLSAYEFDGINDWIEITDTGVFDDKNSISVSVWINAKSRRDHASVIYKGIEITGRNYFFRIATPIEEENLVSSLPKGFELFQNYPNPFNPITAIGYRLLAVSDVELGIYNMLGQKVAVLVSERQSAGSYQVQWDASGYASSVYLYRIITDTGFSDTKKLLLLK